MLRQGFDMYAEFENRIAKDFEGYHITMMLFPSGGVVDATGCDECGTSDDVFESVRWQKSKGESLGTALVQLKSKL